MEQFHSSDIRNFAIVGHGASGKTSLAEAILILVEEAYIRSPLAIMKKCRKNLNKKSFKTG